MIVLGGIVLSQVISVCAQVSLKLGMQSAVRMIRTPLQVWKVAQSPLIWLGGGLYAAGTLLWLRILSKADLSYAYPFAALAYVGGVLVSQRMLGEKVSLIRWIGVITILVGLILIATSETSTVTR